MSTIIGKIAKAEKYGSGWIIDISSSSGTYCTSINTYDVLKKGMRVTVEVSVQDIKHLWINGKKYK